MSIYKALPPVGRRSEVVECFECWTAKKKENSGFFISPDYTFEPFQWACLHLGSCDSEESNEFGY